MTPCSCATDDTLLGNYEYQKDERIFQLICSVLNIQNSGCLSCLFSGCIYNMHSTVLVPNDQDKILST